MRQLISGWGNYPVTEAEVCGFSGEDELRATLDTMSSGQAGGIPRGLARSYGDSSLAPRVISTHRFNRFLAFDPESGRLTCESGVSLADILDVFVPMGWFLSVTPGTRFVSVGGAIASDVHGKNHHLAGSFCNHLEGMDVMLPGGEVLTCSRTQNPELFRATCGGMGLTGVVLRATLNMLPIDSAYIYQETERAGGLDHVMDLFRESSRWTYSVAWIDCLSTGSSLGRSVLMRGEHSPAASLDTARLKRGALTLPHRRKFNVPFNFPSLALNNLSVRAFNALYYGKASRGVGRGIVDYDSFFYPLDSIGNWNRIYGRRGFVQYQFVLPLEASQMGMRRILERIASSGMGSFLAVLKLFGRQEGMMAFPMEGYTLALDFAMKRGLLELLNELDRMVLDYGGRLYLSKDARMSANTLRASYPALDEFISLRQRFDPEGKLSSMQSRRLEI